MKRKYLLVTTIIIVILSFVPSGALAKTSLQPPTPDVYLDCGIWVTDPTYMNGYVWTTGQISCATVHPNLKAVTQLWDLTGGRTTSLEHNCQNTSFCTATVKLAYAPRRNWKSAISGYQGSYWNAYWQSDEVYIP